MIGKKIAKYFINFLITYQSNILRYLVKLWKLILPTFYSYKWVWVSSVASDWPPPPGRLMKSFCLSRGFLCLAYFFCWHATIYLYIVHSFIHLFYLLYFLRMISGLILLVRYKPSLLFINRWLTTWTFEITHVAWTVGNHCSR